jgi:predicted nuclease of restriction endonuclease-like (RecB) superfamily
MPRTTRPLYTRVREILESARTRIARSVNTTQVVANWLVGREIVEEEQMGNKRADYGERLMHALSARLQREYGSGYGLSSLKNIRSFYLAYPELLTGEKGHALRDLFAVSQKSHAVRGLSSLVPVSPIRHTVRGESWAPGQLHSNLSWTHYRTLLRADSPAARAFYEIEAIQQCWSARELERQIASLLFERLAKSRDKTGVRRLALKGQEILSPADLFKDPVVIEFIGLPESPRLVESDLEQALLNQLQSFLLELGKGFAFVARQQRLTLDGDHFYIDLVFYHIVLKCYVLLDLKVGKLAHQDLGQLQLYVNYYDREKRTPGDNPTLGLILCTDKNDAVVKYTLGEGPEKKIFASRYKLHLPTEAALRAEVRRELKRFSPPPSRA